MVRVTIEYPDDDPNRFDVNGGLKNGGQSFWIYPNTDPIVPQSWPKGWTDIGATEDLGESE